MAKTGNFQPLLWIVSLLFWNLESCICQNLQGLNPEGVNVCSRTRRITQYVLMEPLQSSPLPLGAEESSASEREGEEPNDLVIRPRSRVGVRNSNIIVYECCPGWQRGNGTSCDKAICRGSCNNGHCVFPNRCDCDAGWTGSSCAEPCLPYSTRIDCACPPGFTGQGCAQPCAAGTFGKNCRLTCTCIDGECDPVSGVCNNNYVQGYTVPPLVVTEVNWPLNGLDETTHSTSTSIMFPEIRYPLKKSGMKITMSVLCGIIVLVVTVMISLSLCGRWKQRASLYRKQSCKRAILPRQTQDGEIEESVQMPERSITSASMITQPNSYMYMSFNEQESIARSERSVTTGHDLTSLINGYASYTSTTTGTSTSEEPIYEVKLSNSDEEKMFAARESAESNYTDADDVLNGPRVVPGKETSDNEESALPDEEYEYPYVDCKAPETVTQGCNSPSCPISSHEQTTSQQDTQVAVGFPPRRESSVSSSEDYCQADAIPAVKITEVPIDGTYTALIRHPEPEYSTTVTFSSPRGSPKDLSNIVGYVTSVSAVSFKHPPRPAVRRNTNEQTNRSRPPSASRLKLHQFRDVIEPEIQNAEPKQGSYVNDCVQSPSGKEKIKRPVPAPRARLLPAHLMENVEDMVL